MKNKIQNYKKSVEEQIKLRKEIVSNFIKDQSKVESQKEISKKTGINENSINPDIVHKSPRGGSIRIRYEKKYKKKLIL